MHRHKSLLQIQEDFNDPAQRNYFNMTEHTHVPTHADAIFSHPLKINIKNDINKVVIVHVLF